MLTVEEAQEQVLAAVTRLDAEERPLLQALGSILAADAVTDIDLPPFANSAMDGYAVHASDTAIASSEHPCVLRVIGEIAAGDAPAFAVPAGSAARIMTGAPLPAGADAVIPVEQTAGDRSAVHILAPVTSGTFVRRAGEDFRQGASVLTSGMVLGPGELGLLASSGHAFVQVYRRPEVAVLSTGNELIAVDQKPRPGQIRNSNTPMLAAQVRAAGAVPRMLPVARDSRQEVLAALEAARSADLIISSGGVSAGDHDVVRDVMKELGGVGFWRVRMRPGKPIAFGRAGRTPFLGLPGNPVSAYVTFELFARPMLRKMAGHKALLRRPITMLTDSPVSGASDRRNYVRAFARWEDDGWHVSVVGKQESHLLSSAIAVNALIAVPEGSPDAAAGSRVQAILLDWPEQPWP
jgi:molybdopterin molybdotransferase